MKKLLIFFILLLLLYSVSAYQADIIISSGGDSNSTNYQSDVCVGSGDRMTSSGYEVFLGCGGTLYSNDANSSNVVPINGDTNASGYEIYLFEIFVGTVDTATNFLILAIIFGLMIFFIGIAWWTVKRNC